MMADRNLQLPSTMNSLFNPQQPPNYLTNLLTILDSIKHEPTRPSHFSERRFTDSFILPPPHMPNFLPQPGPSRRGNLQIEPSWRHFPVYNQRNHYQRSPPQTMKPSMLGFTCQLCEHAFDTAVELAQHCCPRIIQKTFKCFECDKAFSCSANLASHQRWHRPKSILSSDRHSHQPPFICYPRLPFRHRSKTQSLKPQHHIGSCPTPVCSFNQPVSFRSSEMNRKKQSSFSIESILAIQPSAKYQCFRCGLESQSREQFEDHILEHLIPTKI